jgi:single-strand DNA-binding protein
MPSLNACFLIGNLTRDPELRYTTKGTPVCELSLAINRQYSGEDGEKKEEVTFVDVTLWARQAEIAAEFLRKGSACMIAGRLSLDQWEDKQTGQKRSRLRVVAENLQLLGSRQESESPASSTPRPAAPPRPPGQRLSSAVREQIAGAPTRPIAGGRIGRDPDLGDEPTDIPFRSRVRREARMWRGAWKTFV